MSQNSASFDEQKKLLHYQIVFQAFVDSRLEIDKQLLAICTGAVGLLISIHTTLIKNPTSTCLFGLSLLLFIVDIFLILNILDRNSDYLIAEHTEHPSADTLASDLKRKDYLAKYLFLSAVILAVISLATTYIPNGDEMNNQNSPKITDRSLSGAGSFRPTPTPSTPPPPPPTNNTTSNSSSK